MHQVDMQTHGVRGWTPQEAEWTFSCLQIEKISERCSEAVCRIPRFFTPC